MKEQKANILLADDHRLILAGLVKILAAMDEVGEVYTANLGKEVLESPFLKDVQLLVTDIEMPGMSGIELLKKVKELHPEIKVLILTMHNNAALAREIIKLNADGYILKTATEKDMQSAVSGILSGTKYFSHDVTMELAGSQVKSQAPGNELHELTQREQEILVLIAQGFSTKQIGDKLFVSFRTVDTHRTNLMNKLDIHNVAGLTRFAIQNKLI